MLCISVRTGYVVAAIPGVEGSGGVGGGAVHKLVKLLTPGPAPAPGPVEGVLVGGGVAGAGAEVWVGREAGLGVDRGAALPGARGVGALPGVGARAGPGVAPQSVLGLMEVDLLLHLLSLLLGHATKLDRCNRTILDGLHSTFHFLESNSFFSVYLLCHKAPFEQILISVYYVMEIDFEYQNNLFSLLNVAGMLIPFLLRTNIKMKAKSTNICSGAAVCNVSIIKRCV